MSFHYIVLKLNISKLCQILDASLLGVASKILTIRKIPDYRGKFRRCRFGKEKLGTTQGIVLEIRGDKVKNLSHR